MILFCIGFADFFMDPTFSSAMAIVQPDEGPPEKLKGDLIRFYLYTDYS